LHLRSCMTSVLANTINRDHLLPMDYIRCSKAKFCRHASGSSLSQTENCCMPKENTRKRDAAKKSHMMWDQVPNLSEVSVRTSGKRRIFDILKSWCPQGFYLCHEKWRFLRIKNKSLVAL